jgi:hypothetical protein
MKSRDRVLKALDLKVPDKVPYMELLVDAGFGQKLLGREEKDYQRQFDPVPGIHKDFFGFLGWNYYNPVELCERLHLDAWNFALIPDYLSIQDEAVTREGSRSYYTGGVLQTWDDLKKIVLPGPKEMEPLYEKVNDYVNKYRQDYAVAVNNTVSVEPVVQGFGGIKNFALMIYDNQKLIEEAMDIYANWLVQHTKRLSELDFDIIWFGDDLAFNSGLMFSPDFFREACMPRIRKVTEAAGKPAILHTDGNINEVAEDLIALKLNALHPIDSGGMDIFDFKKKYQGRICCIGNIEMNSLSMASPEEVYEETKEKVSRLKEGGGYIMSSGSCLTVYCRVENVDAMIKAFEEYR